MGYRNRLTGIFCVAGALSAGVCLAVPLPHHLFPDTPCAERPPAGDSAFVAIHSVPSFYDVFINGKRVGGTPMAEWVRVPHGKVKLRLANPMRKPFDTTLTLAAGEHLEKKFWPDQYPDQATRQPPPGTDPDERKIVPPGSAFIEVDCRPNGTALFLNGKPSGESPNYLSAVPAGLVHIRLVHRCYPTFDTTVTVTVNQHWHKTFYLDPDSATAWAKEDSISISNRKNFYRKHL